MNRNRVGFRNFVAGIVLLAVSPILFSSTLIHAQAPPKVTAGEVVDRESLRAFVTYATFELAKITTLDEGLALLPEFRREGGDWHVGNMYLILMGPNGQVVYHGKYPSIDSKLIVGVTDDDGTKVVEQMLTANDASATLVEWCWDDPVDLTDPRCKDSFAMRYYSSVARSDLIVVGGYYQDLRGVDVPLPDIPLPAISASEVVDRETLKQWVEGSAEWTKEILENLEATSGIFGWKNIVREEGGPFKSGATYLFAVTSDGYMFFHGADPWREGRLVLDNTDFRGTPFVRDLIATAQSGGGFIEYFWDDPTIEGDEDSGTPKVTYAISFKNTLLPDLGTDIIVAGGFYRNFSTAEAEMAATEWLGQFGRSVASQAMEMIGDRVSRAHATENYVEVGGGTLGVNTLLNLETLAAVSTGPSTLLSYSRERLLDGSSFQVSPGGVAGGQGYALWGSGDFMRFSSEPGEGTNSGEVGTVALGADYSFGSTVAGLAVAYSSGSGDFELGRPGQDDVGEISTSLTSAFPYARFTVSDRLLAWSVLGYGVGQLEVTGGGEEDPESDITMQMAGLGLEGMIVKPDDPGGIDLSLRSDASIARVNSEPVEGLSELTTNVSRIRLGLGAGKRFMLGAGTSLRTELRGGLRYDGGDTETGFGMEVGGKVRLSALERRLTVSLNGRTLIVHEAEGYSDWGFGGVIAINPGGQRHGLSLSLKPKWGSTANQMTRLWEHGVAGMTNAVYGNRQVDTEIGYGIKALGSRGLIMPYAKLSLLQHSSPTHLGLGSSTSLFSYRSSGLGSRGMYGYQLGGRLTLTPGLSANIEAGRSLWGFGSGPINSATVNLAVNW